MLRRQPRLNNGIVRQELVELGNKLLELAEDEEGAVLGPRRTSDIVTRQPDKNLPSGNNRLTRFWVLEAGDGWVRNAVQEAKVWAFMVSAIIE